MIQKSIILSCIVACLCMAMREEKPEDAAFKKLRPWLLERIENTCASLRKIGYLHSDEGYRDFYMEARREYKMIEFFVEYCSPREAKYYVNGPLVPKQDEENGKTVIYPNGFQKLEELLYAGQTQDSGLLKQAAYELVERLRKLHTYYRTIEISDAQLLEMCQLEIYRIAALNLNGYDATINHETTRETAYCMNGMEYMLGCFSVYEEKASSTARKLRRSFARSAMYLELHPDYNSFPRLQFIVDYINPLNELLVSYHNALTLPWTPGKQAILLDRKTLFSEQNFNPRFFSMYYDDTANITQQARLGKLLFSDPLLSGNGRVSCSSCHKPELSFTDTLARARSVDGHSMLGRNTPSLYNTVYQKAFFADGRAYQLEQQVEDVVHNRDEMGSSLQEVVVKLRRQSSYRLLFSSAFKGTEDTSITEYAVKKAITEYENTLLAFDSRFDKYLSGHGGLSEREINGYNLFAGKALCGSCHFFPLFNGTVPPFFMETEFEVIGTPDAFNREDDDLGRYKATGIPEQMHAFKAPGLRHISRTAPYMHNGVYKNLEQVLDFYQKGGGLGMKLDYPNQTLPFDSLQLSRDEKEDIILFLETL